MNLRIIKLLILLVFAGNLHSCKKKEEFPKATGTIIGTYNCDFVSILVQVDEEYPIGKTIELTSHARDPLYIPNGAGTYHNVIHVPYYKNVPCMCDWPKNEPIINRRLSFSYRVADDIEDNDLFSIEGGICQAIYGPPILPRFVIMKCKILE